MNVIVQIGITKDDPRKIGKIVSWNPDARELAC